jgi:ApaG protein
MYTKTTNGIKVSVNPVYAESNTLDKRAHIWLYHILIENHSFRTIKLLSRYWRIIDALGAMEEVHGDGVVGKQPVLHSNEMFEYSSYVTLNTETGMMSGKYIMEIVDNHGELLEVEIPSFSLESPYSNIMIN